MKLSKLTLVASVIISIIIMVIVLFYDSLNDSGQSSLSLGLILLISFLLIFIITFVGIEFLFSFYARKQIRKMTVDLPKNFFEDSVNVGFKELSERITQSASEIDMIKEMESYRKEYIGNVSHELKTPLFSIQGYIETLSDGGMENLAIRDKYIDRIKFSVERLLNIVNDLDMINRYESGEISLKVSKFDLNKLIQEVFDMLEFEAESRNAKMQMNPALPQVFVMADKDKISQVLINLLSNAIHYSNRQQAIITVQTKILKRKVLVEVIDNGMGIKPESLPRIFERFYRVETSRNRREGGSGLGLAIVKHIMEAHGESISVDSVYLEGTKFSFFLEKA